MLDQYRSLLASVDAWFARSLESSGEQVRCRKGCSGCCRGLFDISLLDAGLLQQGFATLDENTKGAVLEKAGKRLAELQQMWPDFGPPYLLNHMPDEMWTEMPEEDLTPCPLLGEDGLCLVYAYRPMTCRLHGLPNVDLSGEPFSDQWCSLNFPETDPLIMEELRWNFRAAFEAEIDLCSRFAAQALGVPRAEFDSLIPTALFIDFGDRQTLRRYLDQLP